MQTGNRRKYVIAFDSMKGCLSSEEAGQAVAEAIKQADGGAETVVLTVSDGGEGMLRAFTKAVGGNIVRAYVHDPMMRRVWAEYGVTPDGTAIIEAAQACGLTLVSEEERNPMRATTYGTGELVAAAIDRGCRRFIVGLGGSGTSDAGIGMLRALTDRLAPSGGTIDDALKDPLGQCHFTLACDVDNPFAATTARQWCSPGKKAQRRICCPCLSNVPRGSHARRRSTSASTAPAARGAGAAGGLGYAFMQYMNAETRPGAELMLDICGFDTAVDGATCVITGEGHADRQTLMGKLPVCVMRRAGRKGVPTWLLAGRAEDKEELISAGFERVESITPDGMTLTEAMKKEVAAENIACSAVKVVINS